MSTIYFNYGGKTMNIQCTEANTIESILSKISNKMTKKIYEFNFFVDLNNFDSNYTLGEMQSHLLNKNLVIELRDSFEEKREKSEKSKQIICPKCFSLANIKFDNYKIRLYKCKCKIKHKLDNILLEEFEETQKIPQDYLHIVNNNKNIFKCEEHNDLFCAYCKTCKQDLCPYCRSEHKSEYKNHNIFSLSDLLPDKKDLSFKYQKLIQMIDKTNKIIEEYINKLLKVKISLDTLKNTAQNLFQNYDPKKRSYHILKNINNFKFDFVIKDLDDIIKDITNNCNFKKFNDLYNKMMYTKEINIMYNLNEENIKTKKIKIFGEDFVKNNKNKCKIIYKNLEYEITEELLLKNEDINNINNEENEENKEYEDNKEKDEKEKKKFRGEENLLTIKLRDINNISNFNNMFNNCTQLIDLPDISKMNPINIKSNKNMFDGCSNLNKPDLSRLKTNNAIDISDLFKFFFSSQSLTEKSKGNESKIENMIDSFSKNSKIQDNEFSE